MLRTLGGPVPRTVGCASALALAALASAAVLGKGVVTPSSIVTSSVDAELPRVNIFDGIPPKRADSFLPFGGTVRGTVRVAVGDVNGDDVPDVIASAGPGLGPVVRVIDGSKGNDLLQAFLAYDAGFAGGVFVAAGDISGDGRADIITGADADAAGSPHVKVFDGETLALLRSFLAYDAAFTGGVRVAAGDVNGDGTLDIITAPGAGGPAHVKVFSGIDNSVLRSFIAYTGFTGGIFVAGGDVNNDGSADIVTSLASGASPQVSVFDGVTLAPVWNFLAYAPGATQGVTVATGDVNGDGIADIITGAASGGPHVKVFDGGSLDTLQSFFAFGSRPNGGVFVAGLVPPS